MTLTRSQLVGSLLAIAAGSLQVGGYAPRGTQSLARSRFEGTGQISAGQIRSLPNLFRINHSFAVL